MKWLKNKKDKLIREAANSHLTMRKAAESLGIPLTTYIRHSKRLGVHKPNQGGKGITRKTPSYAYLLEDIFAGKYPHYNTGHLKYRMLKEGMIENKCKECGISEWNGKELICHLDHINGDSTDHRKKNLRMLCPNCHSQTPTYCGKNIKKNRN